MNNITSLWIVIFILSILFMACAAQEVVNSRNHEMLKNQLLQKGLIKEGSKHGSRS